jgi:hypothetical protein
MVGEAIVNSGGRERRRASIDSFTSEWIFHSCEMYADSIDPIT